MDKNYEPTLLLTLLLPTVQRRAAASRAVCAPGCNAAPDEQTLRATEPGPCSDDESSDRPTWAP
jgi:hypothetical protein